MGIEGKRLALPDNTVGFIQLELCQICLKKLFQSPLRAYFKVYGLTFSKNAHHQYIVAKYIREYVVSEHLTPAFVESGIMDLMFIQWQEILAHGRIKNPLYRDLQELIHFFSLPKLNTPSHADSYAIT